MSRLLRTVVLGAALLGSLPLLAGEALSEGEIRRIDADSQRITLRHGPIENLGMAAMTMRFTLVDGASLEGLAVGDQVRFRAEQRDGAYVVSELQRAD